ncbi:DUF3592 domain-containing protein [Hymenobacter sp. BT635]|uniref:DUF3592 domain-containing protein n=1 Tax=Hymenobacter nitidus TaxID=2880929 RepID=A0ABS8AAC0_9BACT|nr:DUF3592 domain-containing protein [Hymenobacter nitidus]MCB2376851.1 DUF3592 domain-containing protein [Hymenobacter nitidus]
MIQKELLFGLVTLINVGLAVSELRKYLRHRYLRQFGMQAAATILVAQQIRQKNKPIMRLDIEYRDEAGQRQQARVVAPDSEDSFDYLVGNEVVIRYDPLRPAHCETEDVLNRGWWESPLVLTLLLLAGSGFMLGITLKWW